MAMKGGVLAVVAIMMVVVNMGMTWQVAVAKLDPTCQSSVLTMVPCVEYAQAGASSGAEPSSACCSALSSLISENPDCFCQLLEEQSIPGLDSDRAKQAAQACSITLPSQVLSCLSSTSTPSGTTNSGSPAPSSSSPPTPSSSNSSTTPNSTTTSSTTSSPSSSQAPGSESAPTPKGESGDANSLLPSMVYTFLLVLSLFQL